jgi:hypothetical protein
MYTLWLSDIIFSMKFSRGDRQTLTEEIINPAYTEWEHAETRLQGRTKIDRKDGLSALNRAVLHRLKGLNELYHFRAIPGIDTTLKNTELLYNLGLARGSVLDLIRQLRNRVEHELHDPPDYELCNLYLDAVWYFLRSTDSFMIEVTKEINVFDSESDCEIAAIFISPPKWQVYIEGPVADAPVSFLHNPDVNSSDVYPIEINRIVHDPKDASPSQAMANENAGFLFCKHTEYVEFFGEIKDTECIKKLVRKYFSLLH